MVRSFSRNRTGAKGTLFERLRADDEQTPLPDSDLISERIGSVKRNIVNILNTRSGSAPAAPELGLGDFNDSAMNSSDMLSTVARDIRRCVETYEARVSNVDVSFDRDHNKGGTLNFTIRASIKINREQDRVLVDVALVDGRHFILR